MGGVFTALRWTALGFSVAFGTLIINRGVQYGKEEEAKKYNVDDRGDHVRVKERT